MYVCNKKNFGPINIRTIQNKLFRRIRVFKLLSLQVVLTKNIPLSPLKSPLFVVVYSYPCFR